MLLPQFFCLTACALAPDRPEAPDHANLTTHPSAHKKTPARTQKITQAHTKKSPDRTQKKHLTHIWIRCFVNSILFD